MVEQSLVGQQVSESARVRVVRIELGVRLATFLGLDWLRQSC